VYRALRSQRDVLGSQRAGLEDRRSDLIRELQQQAGLAAPLKAGIEKRIADLDARLLELDKQIAASDLEVARAAGVPGATVPPPQRPRTGPPDEVFVLAGLFMVIVFVPLSIAFARRIWRRAARLTVSLPPGTDERIANIERGLEAVALEVERIGEGQRFVTQILAERPPHALGSGERTPDLIAARREKLGEDRR
jgi:hypothetical protein